MLLLFTFALMLILGDLVKMIWGSQYRSILAPDFLRGSTQIFGSAFPRYNLFLIFVGPLVAIGLWPGLLEWLTAPAGAALLVAFGGGG